MRLGEINAFNELNENPFNEFRKFERFDAFCVFGECIFCWGEENATPLNALNDSI